MAGRKALLAGLAGLGGLAAAVAAIVTPALAGAADAPAHPPTIYQYAWGDAHARPRMLGFGASGDVLVKFAQWNTWGAASATSTHAAVWVNQCSPDCAQGHYAKYPATATLSRVRRHDGREYFTRLRLTLTGTGKTEWAHFADLWLLSQPGPVAGPSFAPAGTTD
jgi:hypothetical protein